MDQITILAAVQLMLRFFDRTPFLPAGRPEYSQGIDCKECSFFAKSVSSLCFLLGDGEVFVLFFFFLLACKISSIF